MFLAACALLPACCMGGAVPCGAAWGPSPQAWPVAGAEGALLACWCVWPVAGAEGALLAHWCVSTGPVGQSGWPTSRQRLHQQAPASQPCGALRVLVVGLHACAPRWCAPRVPTAPPPRPPASLTLLAHHNHAPTPPAARQWAAGDGAHPPALPARVGLTLTQPSPLTLTLTLT